MKHRNICDKLVVFFCVAFVVVCCLTATCADTEIEINEANFPDINFREYIKAFDTNKDGNLNQIELSEIVEINVDGRNIKTLKGVEYCTSLEELSCRHNELIELDVSRNIALEKIDCSCNALKALDVSKTTLLYDLNCSDNHLTTLDVSCCPKFVRLLRMKSPFIYNQISTWSLPPDIDLCADESVELISVTEMTLEEAESIAISEDNFPEFMLWRMVSEHDKDENGLLSPEERDTIEILDFGVVLETLKGVEYLTALKVLRCEYGMLKTLDISNNTALEELNCSYTWLKTLDVSKNAALKVLRCDSCCLATLDVSNNSALEELSCNKNQLTALDISKQVALKSLECDENQLTTLDVSRNLALEELSCNENQLTALDVNNNTALKILNCNSNKLKSLDIRQNTALIQLGCSANQITVLNTGNNAALLNLRCKNNQLKSLDVSKLAGLKVLDCAYNQLTALDVSNCPNIVKLIDENWQHIEKHTQGWGSDREYYEYSEFFFEADLTVDITGGERNGLLIDEQNFPDAVFRDYVGKFDLNGNGRLQANEINAADEMVICEDIKSLEGIKHFISLKKLYCADCNLTWLDVRENTALVELNCRNNQLTELDISHNTALVTLDCSGNQLTDLNICNCPEMSRLYCDRNKIQELSVRGCPIIVKLINESEPQKRNNCSCWNTNTDNDKKDPVLEVDISVVITGISQEPEEENKIEAFITRCYSTILGRSPDVVGLQTWYDELTSGRKTASEIIDRFVNSLEYFEKHYSNSDSVDILYQAMLGRNADAGGKANWVKKLENGQTLAHVINGFCFSKEFRDLCDSYGIKAGFVNIENADTTAEGKIKAFVQRCYRIILNREPDEGGMITWFNELKSRRKAASEVIERFVNSPEFRGKNYNYNDSVEILYNAMLGRRSDIDGKAHWVSKLENGQPFAVIINGFCVSKEFTGICASYGIETGTVKIQALSGMAEEEALSMLAYKAKAPITKKSESNPTRVEIINPSDTIDMTIGTAVQAVYINEEKAKEFISRCYRSILGREASQAELDNWIGQMTNGTKTPDQIARGFLFSNEFKGKNVSNEDLVKILYKVYMNREADPEGLKTWTEKLDGGTELKALLDVFAKTSEFKKVVNEMSK